MSMNSYIEKDAEVSTDKSQSSDLQNLIDSAAENSEIFLGNQTYVLSSLLISKSVNLIGQDETAIIIEGGSILINPSNTELSCKVHLSGINFSYKAPQDDAESTYKLLQVPNLNTDLEVCDCEFTSESTGMLSFFTVIGINIFNSIAEASNSRLLNKSQSSVINLTRTSITNFEIGIRSVGNCWVNIQSCELSKAKQHSIYSNSPVFCSISKCEISDAGILINSPDSTIADVLPIEKPQILDISLNTFSRCVKNAIEIQSDNISAFIGSIKITKNNFTANKRECMSIRNLILDQLEISHNRIIENLGSGVWLQQVTSDELGCLNISSNIISNCQNGFGIYFNSAVGEILNNDIKHNHLGGLLVVGNHEESLSSLHIKSNRICENNENGISILDYTNGCIEIEDCIINDNTKNGCNFVTSRKSFVKLETFKNKVVSTQTLRGIILMNSCEVKRNKEYGVVMALTHSYLSKCTVEENVQGQILAPRHGNKVLNEIEENSKKGKCESCNDKCRVM